MAEGIIARNIKRVKALLKKRPVIKKWSERKVNPSGKSYTVNKAKVTGWK